MGNNRSTAGEMRHKCPFCHNWSRWTFIKVGVYQCGTCLKWATRAQLGIPWPEDDNPWGRIKGWLAVGGWLFLCGFIFFLMLFLGMIK